MLLGACLAAARFFRTAPPSPLTKELAMALDNKFEHADRFVDKFLAEEHAKQNGASATGQLLRHQQMLDQQIGNPVGDSPAFLPCSAEGQLSQHLKQTEEQWRQAHSGKVLMTEFTTDSRVQPGEICGAGCADVQKTVSFRGEIRADRTFPDAFSSAMDGRRITRAGWNASGQWVRVQWPGKNWGMSKPFMCLRNAVGEMVPWTPTQGDMFATDWAVLPQEAS
jgi:hypothetical protein